MKGNVLFLFVLTLLWNNYMLCSAIVPNLWQQNMPYGGKSEAYLGVTTPLQNEHVPLQCS